MTTTRVPEGLSGLEAAGEGPHAPHAPRAVTRTRQQRARLTYASIRALSGRPSIETVKGSSRNGGSAPSVASLRGPDGLLFSFFPIPLPLPDAGRSGAGAARLVNHAGWRLALLVLPAPSYLSGSPRIDLTG